MEDDGWTSANNPIKSAIAKELRKQRGGESYDVGYAKPPKDTRWKPGQCGNPRGRPKKQERANTERQMLRDFMRACEQEVSITVDGKRKRMPLIAAMYEQALIKALKGDYKFFCKILEMRELAVRTLKKMNPHTIQMLEYYEEQLLALDGIQNDPAFMNELDRLRRMTRKV